MLTAGISTRLLPAPANLPRDFPAYCSRLAGLLDAGQEQVPQHASAYASSQIRIVELASEGITQLLSDAIELVSIAAQCVMHELFTGSSRKVAGLVIGDGRPGGIQYS